MNYKPPLSRREYERFYLDSQVHLSMGHTRVNALLRDLSARGAGIISDFPCGAADEVGFLTTLSSLRRELVNRKAKVTWCNKIEEGLWRIGLDFGMDGLINLEG